MKRLILIWSVSAALLGSVGVWADEGRSDPKTVLAALKEREAKIKSVIDRVASAVVAVTSDNPVGTGSGVVINKEGLILTASHVTDAITEGAPNKQVVIIFPDGRRARGEVLGANRTCDSAMVKITEPALEEWPHVEMGTSDDVAKGQWVVALGQPGGFDPLRSPPVRAGRVWGRDNFGAFFTDCTLVGGDSGGPLFDLEGRLIGIHSSIGGPLTVNRHVGIDNFRTDWDKLLRGESWGRLTLGEADPERPVIGAELDEQSASGVRVLTLVPDGPAARAGITTGDVITHFAGGEVKNYLNFVRLISRRKPGDTVTLRIRRGEAESVEVDLGLISRQAIKHLHQRVEPPPPARNYLGAEVETASPAGARITALDPESPAARAGLHSGDIIVAVEGVACPDVVALANSLRAKDPGSVVVIKVRQGDAEHDLSVTLAAPPGAPPSSQPDATP